MTGAEVPIGLGLEVSQALAKLYRKRHWARQLTRAVANEHDFNIPKRKLTRLLKTEELKELLQLLDPTNVGAIAATIRPLLAMKVTPAPSDSIVDQQALALAETLQRKFLEHLDPKQGLALIHRRHEHQFDDLKQQFSFTQERRVLPGACEERLTVLGQISPRIANQTRILLAEYSLRHPEAIHDIVVSPTSWLQDAPFLVWEVVADFMDAYHVDGSRDARQRASDLGTPRTLLYELQEIMAVFESAQNGTQAQSLIHSIDSEDPLVNVVLARMDDEPEELLSLVHAHALDESIDPDIALFVISMKTWALAARKQLDLAIEITKSATVRFPNRASLYLRQAQLKFALACQSELGSRTSYELLSSAVSLALEARDQYRKWLGPSGSSVELATRCLLAMDELERTRQVATQEPSGEATSSEANDPGVRTNLAIALLRSGRNDELRDLELHDIAEFDRLLLEAFQARNRGDPGALNAMRRALTCADDEASRIKALHGLALFGQVEDSDLRLLSNPDGPDAALIEATNAIQREDYPHAISLLRPYRSESTNHARCLADAQRLAGLLDDAYATLIQGAERLNDPSLLYGAIVTLVDLDKLDEAEDLARSSVATGEPPQVEYALRRVLVEIAERKRDWRAMETYAQGLAQRFSDDRQAAWAVVVSLSRQARQEDAFSYMVGHDLIAIDEDSSVLEILLRSQFDHSSNAIERILELAEGNRNSETVIGSALVGLTMHHAMMPFNDVQRARLAQLTSEFIDRFPDSRIFGVVQATNETDFISAIEERLRPGTTEQLSLIERVRLGSMPYGALQSVSRLHYAEALIGFKAGFLSAISPDPNTHSREQEVARAAIGTLLLSTLACRSSWTNLLQTSRR